MHKIYHLFRSPRASLVSAALISLPSRQKMKNMPDYRTRRKARMPQNQQTNYILGLQDIPPHKASHVWDEESRRQNQSKPFSVNSSPLWIYTVCSRNTHLRILQGLTTHLLLVWRTLDRFCTWRIRKMIAAVYPSASLRRCDFANYRGKTAKMTGNWFVLTKCAKYCSKPIQMCPNVVPQWQKAKEKHFPSENVVEKSFSGNLLIVIHIVLYLVL